MNRAVGSEAAPKLCAILEALGVLEAATQECKQRNINTPEVKDALDLLQLFVEPARLIPQFRNHLECDPNFEVDKEAQQQVLRATFPSIRHSIKEEFEMNMEILARKFAATHDMKVKEKLEQLARNYRRVKQPWVFRPKYETKPLNGAAGQGF